MENIRLVIWDMDETFWQGTLAEGKIVIPELHKKIIIELTNRGIINSIASKNEFDKVKEELEKNRIWDYFVFPQISWEGKGSAVKHIVECIKLRPETILFIDDNVSNREEVKFYVPGINVSSPDIIGSILDDEHFAGKNDNSQSRLKQYKILEKKQTDEKKYSSNEEFLLQSNIRVNIIRDKNLLELDRIYELNQRANQLNYTKIRLSKEELSRLTSDDTYDTGMVSVKDNYGDYGIVGFFACKNGKLEQYFFSCRTLGLGIEQWVYSQLNFPELTVVGDVAISLVNDNTPTWINASKYDDNATKESASRNIEMLLIGGCDLEQTAFYLEQSGVKFHSQFNYIVDGRFECHPDSSEILRGSQTYSESDKEYLVNNCPFYDDKTFTNILFTKKYNVVVYSPLIDFSYGMYQSKKNPDLYVMYGNKDFPNLSIYGYMTEKEQETFNSKFDFLGGMSVEHLRDNLEWIRKQLPKETLLVCLNGSEVEIKHPYEIGRKTLHHEMNKMISEFCMNNDNTYLLDIIQIIKSDSDHTDNIRHYTRKIYYQIAVQILDLLKTHDVLESKTTYKLQKGDFITECRRLMKRREDSKLGEDLRQNTKKVLRKLGLLEIAYKLNGKSHRGGVTSTYFCSFLSEDVTFEVAA
mgnify:FL=1